MKWTGRVHEGEEETIVSFAVSFKKEETGLSPQVTLDDIKEMLEKRAYDQTLCFLRILIFDIELNRGLIPNQINSADPVKESKKRKRAKKRRK